MQFAGHAREAGTGKPFFDPPLQALNGLDNFIWVETTQRSCARELALNSAVTAGAVSPNQKP